MFILNLDKAQMGQIGLFFAVVVTEIKLICGHVIEFFLPNSLRRLQPSSAFPVPCTFR